MAGPVTTKKADAVSARVGVPSPILQQIIAFLMSLMGGCALSPKAALVRAKALANGENYLGHRLDKIRKRKAVQRFAPDNPDEVEASLDDELDQTTEEDMANMMAEAQTP